MLVNTKLDECFFNALGETKRAGKGIHYYG